MKISNFNFDLKNGTISWECQNQKYFITKDKLKDADYFENETTILVLCGELYVETHLYAYDVYGNFKFEVLAPENYTITISKKIPMQLKGLVMGMECRPILKKGYCEGKKYAINPITGELTESDLKRKIYNFEFDREHIVFWKYQNHEYSITRDKLQYAEYFDNEETILVLCGEYDVETHLYAYDYRGNYKFEVMPPENHMIYGSMPVVLPSIGWVMGMKCLKPSGDDTGFGEQYAINSETGELTFAGRIKWL